MRVVTHLRETLALKSDCAYTLRFAYASDQEDAKAVVQRYLEDKRCYLRSSSFVDSCLFATLRKPKKNRILTKPELIVIPYGTPEDTQNIAWKICYEVCSLAALVGQVNRLYSERELIFSQADSSEREMQLRINEILAEMRRPVDEIQPVSLEDTLKELAIQFSRLSTLASSTRRDYIKARSLLRQVKNLLADWDERPIGRGMTYSSVEMSDLENLVVPFRDFMERMKALTTQLETVLDYVRTYVGIQQQKTSIMEQSSSKEQLVRLVNFQETLDKLQILVTAVYLTEMAKIIFESILHEWANLLTAGFIPCALFISVVMSKLLGKNRSQRSYPAASAL